MKTAPAWIWGAYYSLAVYFVLGGVYQIVQAFVDSQKVFMGEKMGFTFFSYIMIAIGAIRALIGLGLLFRVEAVRGIVNFVCGMQIIFGLFSLAGAVMGTMFSGAYGLLLVLVILLDIGTAGFMIYVIGETDKAAPNL